MRPQRVRDIFQATEAVFDDESLRATVTLIRPGMSANRKNWSPVALKKASESGFWNGTRMFLDHSQQQSGSSLPRKKSRSIKDLVSGIESTAIGEDGRVVGTVKFFDKDFYTFAKEAKDFMGTSVDLLFAGKEVKTPGQEPYYAVEELVVNNSVDWVVFPAAGGQIEQFLTAHEGEDNVEWNEVTEAMLREHRPELVAALESKNGNPPPTPPVVGVSEDKVAEIVAKAVTEAQESWDKDRRDHQAVTRSITERVGAAKLPSKTASRLIASFDGADKYDETAVDAAIKQAREELEDAGIKPHIRGLGPSDSTGGDSKPQKLTEVAPIHAALESVFGRSVSGKKSATTAGGND